MKSGILEELLSHVSSDPEEKALLLKERFGTENAVFEAEVYEIADALLGDEKTAIYLKLCVALASRRGCERLTLNKKHTEQEITEFLKYFYFGISVETVAVISMDPSCKVISVDRASEGTVNLSNVLPRKILEIAKKRGADSVAIAHNHPGGFAQPSGDDIESSKLLTELLFVSGIKVYGHYIVAGNDCLKIQ